MVAVKAGDRIAIRYRARGPGGEVVASSNGSAALEMIAGGDDVISGVSIGVIGMQVGERKVLQLAPEAAFGRAEGAVERLVPVNRLPENVAVGDQVHIAMAGLGARVWVVAREADAFRIRSEHVLAGQALIVEVQLVSLLNLGCA